VRVRLLPSPLIPKSGPTKRSNTMSPISTNDLDKITSTIALAMQQGFSQLTAALSQPVAASRAATAKTTSYRYSTPFLAKGQRVSPSDLKAKDAAIVQAFRRRGFDAHLMDRDDPKVPYDVRPYRKWLEVGRVVRKGQRGVKGLFHVTQTDALPTATPPKGKKLAAVKS
jgi:hypothetical protein